MTEEREQPIPNAATAPSERANPEPTGDEPTAGARWERLDELDEPVPEPDDPNTLERLGRLSELGPHGPVGL